MPDIARCPDCGHRLADHSPYEPHECFAWDDVRHGDPCNCQATQELQEAFLRWKATQDAFATEDEDNAS